MESGFSHPVYARIAALFTARTGIACVSSRTESIEAGIKRAQEAAGFLEPWEYFVRLGDSRALLEGLVAELAIGETYFLRDSEQMQALRAEVLPELVARRGASHRLRVWSAGCSSGEEAYSLAILLDGEGLLERSDILATDLNLRALARARSGRYREWSLRGVDESVRARYFREAGAERILIERIRDAVRFEPHNLISCDPPGGERSGFDLILCRNVVIYFEPQTVKEVAERFYRYLAPGGWLMMGASDAPLWDYAPFTPVKLPGCVLYYKGVPNRASAPAICVAESSGDLLPPVLKTPPNGVAAPPSVDATSARLAAAQAALAAIQQIAAQDGSERAFRVCAEAAAQQPFDAGLQILSALLLLDLKRLEEARNAARRAIYLDRALPLAHFVLGNIALERADAKEALISFRNARDCAAALPKDTPITLFEGGRAGQLAQSARLKLTLLGYESSPRTPKSNRE